MAAQVIAQLSSLVRDLEFWLANFSDVPCTNDEVAELDALGVRLAGAGVTVQKKTGALRPSREEQAWEATE